MQLFKNSACCWPIPKRYCVTFLVIIGHFISTLIHSSVIIAIIEMTSNKTIIIGNETRTVNADFNWSSKEKGVILSIFALGYVLSCTASFIVYKLGGATSFGAGLAIMAMIELLMPFLLQTHFLSFLLARALQGFMEGFSYAGCMDVMVRWTPPSERVLLCSLANSGISWGLVLGYPLSGYVAYNFGWPALFYLSGYIQLVAISNVYKVVCFRNLGIAGLIWSGVWFTFVRNDPAVDILISDSEKLYLANEIKNISMIKYAIPWKSIFTSKAVYAVFNEYFTSAWLLTFLVAGFPLYVKDVLNVNTQQVGLITSIPLVCGVIMQPVAGFVADYLRSNMMSVSKLHKICLFWSQLFIICCLLTAALWGSFITCVVCFTLSRIAYCVAMSSYLVIHIDIAGQYACVVKSISMSCLSIGAMLSPLTFGYMVPNHSQSEWNYYFLFLSFIGMYSVVVFLIFGSGELQPWAYVKNQDNDDVQRNKMDSEN